MKIVHISQSLGGVKTYLEHLFTYKRDNITHVVLAPPHSEFQKFCQDNGVHYYPIGVKRAINPFNDLMVLFSIIRILNKENPDIVHAHSAKGGYLGRIAAKIINMQVIYSPHAFSYLSFKGLKRIIFYMLEYVAKSWTDVLLCVSHSERNRAVYEVGYHSDKVKVVLNSIPISEADHLRDYSKCQKIGMIGRLTDQKNPFLFLEIAELLLQKHPHLEFSILGAGFGDTLSIKIKKWLDKRQLSSKVALLEWGDHETTKQFLRDIDIFVMTSVFEGLPFALIEAMSSGVPSVVSKVDGNTDVISNNENGFACLTGNEFFTKIDLLVTNPNIRAHIGLAGYNSIVNKHNIASNAQEIEQLYFDLAGRKRTASASTFTFFNKSNRVGKILTKTNL